MIPDPSFDEQSARAMIYALLDSAGEVAGIFADTEEITKADGDIGYRPVLRIHGRISWHSTAIIWAGTGADDATLARAHALERARAEAVDRIVRQVQRDDAWGEALQRFRREPNSQPDPQPTTQHKEESMKNDTPSPETKLFIELAFLDREIESLDKLREETGLTGTERERLKTLLHQRDVTRVGGSHASQTAGTPEPGKPTPLEAEGGPEVEQAGAPDVMVSPGERAGGAQVVPNAAPVEEEPTLWDLNWIVGQVVGGIANIDTSGRVVAEASMRTARATERIAVMAEARELRAVGETFAAASLDARDDEQVEEAEANLETATFHLNALRVRLAPLLSVPDQVAAEDHADGADEGGEAASLGEDPPAPHTSLPMLDRIRHVLRGWTGEENYGPVHTLVDALGGGDTIWVREELTRLTCQAAEAKTDGG